LACAPAAITPIPTLDPEKIGTYIVQTANAASTQTAAAIPVYEATSTFAPTFTPVPTFTTVPLISLPSPVSSTTDVQYYRVKHDRQLAYYNYKSRTADPGWNVEAYGLQTPEIAQLNLGLDLKSGTNWTDVSAWGPLIDQLNNHDEKKLHYVKADNTALFDGRGFPIMESVTMGGNVLTLNEVRGRWGRVKTLNPNHPVSIEEFNYLSRPDVIHKFVIVGWKKSTQSTYLTNPPPPYNDLYWPMIASKPVWIPMEFLERFPPLPLEVTANVTLDVKTKPGLDSSSAGFDLVEGEKAILVEYFPSGSSVWGKLSKGGWIALIQYDKRVVQYTTSWQMETVPPLP
jgi:hypothetical protein